MLAYLQTNEPSALKRTGPGEYRHTEHDSLVYSRRKSYWYWNSRGKSINALDYLTEIRGYGFVDAVEALCRFDGRALSSLPSQPSRPSAPPIRRQEPPPFKLPWARRCATFLLSYLQGRGIDYDVILRCFQLGLLYQSQHSGEAVCVFVGRDDTGKARFACVRGIEGDLKKDVAGSDKLYSFCLPPKQMGSRHLAVFEAPIDALSHATLQKLEGWKWNGYRLSLGGTSSVALVAFLERHPEISRVALYMDNDHAGLINAHKIKALLKADERFKHIRVSINPPRMGKDYNEKLKRTIESRKEQPQSSRRKQAAISI